MEVTPQQALFLLYALILISLSAYLVRGGSR